MGVAVLFRYFFAFFVTAFVAVLIVGTLVALPQGAGKTTAADAEEVARYWVQDGVGQPAGLFVQPARIEDDEWEVDVVRPDGSLIEVTLDHELRLRDLDEERGPGGRLARDELTGPLRARAIRAAFTETGSARVVNVERDAPDEIEVGVRRPDGSQLEVELDGQLRVGEVEPEDPDDE
jgi:hypothetical protein